MIVDQKYKLLAVFGIHKYAFIYPNREQIKYYLSWTFTAHKLTH